MEESLVDVIAIMHSTVEKTHIYTISRRHSPDHLLIQGKPYLHGRVMAVHWNHVIKLSVTNSGDVMK